jgi:WhiB family redox-sensing transcriptional regulator
MSAAAEIVDVPADMGAALAFMRRYRELERLEAGWREQAACTARTVPPLRHFFPDPSRLAPGSKKLRQARRVCSRCPVRRQCLELVIDEDLEGVWAGTTDSQREATAGLARDQRIRALEQVAFEATTSGPWRVASDEEWRVANLAYTPETEHAPAQPG